jgi:uncharacterized protein (DUF1330 family)
MAGYLIASVVARDPAALDAYRQGIATAVASHGGRYLVRAAAAEALAGEPRAGRVTVIAFPSTEAARRFWHSPEVAAARAAAAEGVTADIVLVEGAALPRADAAGRGRTPIVPSR